ncbi:1-acyl-sn-glycerol-3-phosphate acyltransferase [Mesonia sp. K7]|uniref:lysophospholipid acyltransferase family protein n=1 Tax=Mesonia sp. K7 TaxID=2218606 RepID=UPI000DA8E68A|nr:lysophospholipid acyltransferase family protein [Mesonia sp. K7]PZD77417.1 1-acyl-sn-glycerol-3-phosphate acyltransferase [Mesonia sp. K7]
MKFLKNTARFFWRIWFYIVMGVPIIVMFPILLVLTSREKFYPQFFVVARFWARIIIYGMGFYVVAKKLEKLDYHKSYMFIANHTSMLDIMLMLHLVRNPFVFVGKKELVKIPIFGFFYKRTCILVDRSSVKSRNEVFERAQRRLNQGVSICIFPEGGIPEDMNLVLDQFKDGAFRLAIEHQIPVVPMVFYDNKKRFPYEFFKGNPGKMRATIFPVKETKNLTHNDRQSLKQACFDLMYKELQTKA